MAYRLEWRRRGDVNEIELDRRGRRRCAFGAGDRRRARGGARVMVVGVDFDPIEVAPIKLIG